MKTTIVYTSTIAVLCASMYQYLGFMIQIHLINLLAISSAILVTIFVGQSSVINFEFMWWPLLIVTLGYITIQEELFFRHFLSDLLGETPHKVYLISLVFGIFHILNYKIVTTNIKAITVQVIHTFVLSLILFSLPNINHQILVHLYYNSVSCMLGIIVNDFSVKDPPESNYTVLKYVSLPRRRHSISIDTNVKISYADRKVTSNLKQIETYTAMGKHLSKKMDTQTNKADQ